MEQPRPVDAEALVSFAQEARSAYRYGEAYEAFARAEEVGRLSTEDILAWADAAWWLGRADHALELAELGHRRLLGEGKRTRAAIEAINLGFLLTLRGELSTGSGWLHRARSLAERARDDPATGYLIQLDAEDALDNGDIDAAITLARQAQDFGRRLSDAALVALSLMTEGNARLRAGSVSEAMMLFDEVMLPVQVGAIPPEHVGNLYCRMIDVCWQLVDLRRARKWTAATQRWCLQFDSAVMFSGICRMHRVQLQQLAGDWDAAAADARTVCSELTDMNVGVVAEGHYLLGDLLRLRGSRKEAAVAYRRAHELGRDPQPGMALLRAASDPAAALISLQTALAGSRERDYRIAPLLRAAVAVAVAVQDLAAAREALDELTKVAGIWKTDGLRAAAAQAQGTVVLAAGEAVDAVAPLREAVRLWHELHAPYESAMARALLAEAYTLLGDDETGRLELDAAAATLERLGAAADLERLGRRRSDAVRPGGLTSREAEILTLVAEGVTNRQAGDVLVISEKTVARHLANIYLKLGVSTRTAAAAWARRTGLSPPPA